MITPLPYATPPARVAAYYLSRAPYLLWLDSGMHEHPQGRYSYVALPSQLIRAVSGRLFVSETDKIKWNESSGNPRKEIRRLYQSEKRRWGREAAKMPRAFSRLPWVGGLAGCLGYGMAQCQKDFSGAGSPLKKHPGRLDDALLMTVRTLYVWDHRLRKAFVVSFKGTEKARCVFPPQGKIEVPRFFKRVHSGMTFRDYGQKFKKIQRAIAEGQVYQINLTYALERRAKGAQVGPMQALALFQVLRRKQRVPVGAFLAFGKTQICSFSPEVFLVSDGRRVMSSPMKGTERRSRNRVRDKQLSERLACSEKDRAENLMIADLVRNDLGRVCRVGSVKVKKPFEVQSFSGVHQMVSPVEGELRHGLTAWDALESLFPPGSMTGAPKIRAAQLIRRLEGVERGLYSGVLGFMDVRGGGAWNVLIRTVVLKNGKAWYHTGGGIVADSKVRSEWRESCLKADAFLRDLP